MTAEESNAGVVAPCGRCRQVILDQHPDCLVIVPTDEGPDLQSIRRLLPHSYRFPDARPERFVRFNARYFDIVLDGSKTATARFDEPCAVGPAWLLFEFDDEYKRLPGYVESIETKRYDELTDEDAQLEDGEVANDLREGLRGHYPTLEGHSPVDVVHFRVVADAEGH